MTDVAELLVTFPAKQPFALFGVVREPGAVAHAEPLTGVYEELAIRFNSFVRRNRVEGVGQFGMIVADEAKYERTVQPLVAEWRQGGGARFGRLTKIVEVPLFVDSAASRLVQLADFIAHAIYLAYEGGDEALFHTLKPSFQRRRNGMLDGLVHLTINRAACTCWPCGQRREEPLPGMP